jgi:hypothetical protein
MYLVLFTLLGLSHHVSFMSGKGDVLHGEEPEHEKKRKLIPPMARVFFVNAVVILKDAVKGNMLS